ncbi:hypothetical protein ACQKF0_28795 [Bacillus wiedmannii]
MLKFSYKKEPNKTELNVHFESDKIISVLFGSTTLFEIIKNMLNI